MKNNILATAAGLADRDLLARLETLAGKERAALHRRTAAGTTPHARESPGCSRPGQGSQPSADRSPGGRAGASPGRPDVRAQAPHHHGAIVYSGTGCGDEPHILTPTRSFAASRPFSAARSPTVTPPRSSTAR